MVDVMDMQYLNQTNANPVFEFLYLPSFQTTVIISFVMV
jgi:hypothetical protein